MDTVGRGGGGGVDERLYMYMYVNELGKHTLAYIKKSYVSSTMNEKKEKVDN